MKKRILSVLLVLTMVFSMMPMRTFAATVSYNENSSYNTTITVTDDSGNRISDATVTVTRSSNTYEVYNAGNGQYIFTRGSNRWSYTYTITVSAPNHSTETVTIRGNSSATTVTLTYSGPEIVTFNVFYIADGHVPESGYSGAGQAADYGPSANNTPLVQINVNVTALRELAAQENSPVQYIESGSSGNQWEFVPSGDRNDDNYMDQVNAFWEAVISCTDAESIAAFEETGLYDTFAGYCLKKQNDGSLHCDGVLSVTPPVYVVELYQNETFFGGAVTDSTVAFPSTYSLLDQYEAHLGHVITWQEDGNGKPLRQEGAEYAYYTGTYIDMQTHMIHTISVYQFDDDNADYCTTDFGESEFPYTQQTSSYYLAKFNMYVDEGTPVTYVVTYTDGAANEVVFNDHEYAATRNDTVPAYTGITVREGYTFQGWYLEGSDEGLVYSPEDLKTMTVTGDMTFHAVWAPVPKYTGTVMFVLDGTYDSTTGSLLTGTMVDPGTVLGLSGEVIISVSADGSTFLPLTESSTGVYSAVVENGTYHAYYSADGDQTYTLLSDQPLIMESQDRTRYLFYNSVTYNPNGGTLDGSTNIRTEYYPSGSSVSVYATAPERKGYVFLGWHVEGTTILQPGDALTASIGQAYTLTAQWVEAEDVYVTVIIDHGAHNTAGMRDITFTLDSRPENSGVDFTEIYSVTLAPESWTDGAATVTNSQGIPIYTGTTQTTDGESVTQYTPVLPNLTGVRSDMEYTVTSHKSGYELTEISQSIDANGDLQIQVTLVYAPNDFDFTYEVRLDEEAKALDPQLWPKAVNVKVTAWYSAEGKWHPITQHAATYERVELDANGEGTGSYPVWEYENEETQLPYYYRIEVVSFELQDGTVITADDPTYPHEQYESENKRFFADMEVTGNAASPEGTDLTGAWWNGTAQQGEVAAIVSIPAYTVTLEPNGGTLNGSTQSTVLEDQIITPDISVYVPTREGSYVFAGWFLVEDGQMTDKTVTANDPLTSDITLRAKWKDPITVDGLVTVAGTYEQSDGTISIIPDGERVPSVMVVLQKLTPTGYYETVQQQTLTLDYTQEDYYFQGTRAVGIGLYRFEDLPDDGQYRISILTPNYTAHYQNEPESADADTKKLYNTYNETDYVALPGTVDLNLLTVNAHLHFTPPSFDLMYQVDAQQIGESFRPDSAQILITCRTDPAIVAPSQWAVISQMIQGGVEVGNDTLLNGAGLGSGTESVWKYSYNGVSLYDYGLRLQSATKNGEELPYSYTVSYQSPAYFDEASGQQSQMLIATLVPNTYTVTYDANGGHIYGTYTTSHTWSHTTALTEVTPLRTGYEFGGWYLDEAFTQPLTATTIDASVAEDVTFYAKWIIVEVHLEVAIDHSAATGGNASHYEKLLSVQLTRRDADTSGDFLPVDGQLLSYDSSVWHTSGNGLYFDTMEVSNIFPGLSSSYDYNANVSLDSYYVTDSYTYTGMDDNGDPVTETMYTGATKTERLENDAVVIHHDVVVCLKFDPDLLDLEFSVEMASDVDPGQYPAAAEVKVTAWYDHPETDDGFGWNVISQHTDSVVQVDLDPNTGTGSGTGSYPVWQWLSEEFKVPYYYRIQVVALKLSDGSVISLAEQNATDTLYAGSGYTATVYAENGCDVPVNVDANGNTTAAGTALTGAYGAEDSSGYVQTGTLRAVIDVGRLVFHANNAEAACDDVFRTYIPAGSALPGESYRNLSQDGTVPGELRYDIPEFAYLTHNKYVFKGWYTAADETGEPISWDSLALSGTDPVHFYAHWMETGTVVQAADDDKQLPDSWNGTYQGYDLVGIQLRQAITDSVEHYGDVGAGLRFITVLSHQLYSQINSLPGNESGAEYGFIMAKESSVPAGTEALQYNGKNVNGQDTRTTYVMNLKCSGVPDHFTGIDENGNGYYRLYTGVVTYGSVANDPEKLARAYAQNMVARSYLRYYDANGLYRTYYNNYTGTAVFGGCSASYNMALEMLQAL